MMSMSCTVKSIKTWYLSWESSRSLAIHKRDIQLCFSTVSLKSSLLSITVASRCFLCTYTRSSSRYDKSCDIVRFSTRKPKKCPHGPWSSMAKVEVGRNLVPTLVLHGPTWYATSNMKYSPLVIEQLMPLCRKAKATKGSEVPSANGWVGRSQHGITVTTVSSIGTLLISSGAVKSRINLMHHPIIHFIWEACVCAYIKQV